MFQKKSLIWFVSIALFLNSCISIDRKALLKEFYIMDIPNLNGMLLKNNLLEYFNNQDLQSAKYFIKIEIKITNIVDLRDKYGIESQGRLDLTLYFKVIEKKSNLILLSKSNSFSETYLSGDTFYKKRSNTQRANITLLKEATLYIVYEIYGLLKIFDSQKEKLTRMCLIGQEEADYENSTNSDNSFSQ